MGSSADGQGSGQGDGQLRCSQTGEALAGQVAVWPNTSVDHNLGTWMEQADAACSEVLTFSSHAAVTSIFLNI